MRKMRLFIIALQKVRSSVLFFFCLFLLSAHTTVVFASDKVALQLAWTHQFQFAGYYATLHTGYYRQAGLDVTIMEGGEGRFAREEVLSGRAQYGVAGAELVLQRAEGNPFVVLAAIFQHSGSILLSRGDSHITSPEKLIGKRMMVLPGNKNADILAIFQNEGIPLNLISRIDQSYNLNDLIEGRTDAVSAYITNEPWYLEQAGIKPGIMLPQTYGVDFYSDCLFTIEQEIKSHPDRVNRFLDASLRGWEYAMDHPEEIIDLLISQYAVKKSRDHLRYEARTMESLIFPKLVEMGHMNPGRWRHMADTFVRLGELPVNFSLKGFLYDPDPKPDVKNLKLALFTLVVGFVCASLLILLFLTMNRKLKREVGERKKIEQSLRASESQKEAILQGITTNIAYVDHELKILWVNKGAADSVRRRPEEMIGRRCHEFWADPLKPCAGCPTIQAFHTKKSEQTIMHTLDGRIWDERGEPVFDPDGKLIGVVAIAHDITDRMRAEEKIRESETRLRVIFETSRAGIILVDPNGVIFFANQGMADMFGCTLPELIGSSYPEHVHPDQQTVGDQKMRQLIAGDIDSVSLERHYIRKDGSDFWGFLSGRRHEDANGNFISLVGIIADITEQKKLEYELRQAHKMESIGTLTGGVAHDFNNILTVIIGNAELALDDIPENSPAHTNLKTILSVSLRAAGIVKQLLNFSRKTDQELKPTDAVSAVADAIKFLRSTIPATIEMRSHLPDREMQILADPVQIHQVMMNICTNASHAMEATGGILDITVETDTLRQDDAGKYPDLPPGDYVKIIIRDKGPGIDKQVIDRIFDPYFTTKEVGKGSGLGLAIVHGIIKNHGGGIFVDSQPGNGATFTILFPIIAKQALTENETRNEILRGCETILFVDDEESIAKMMRDMLGRLGYRIETLLNPLEALDAFKANPYGFDLVITDMTMPQMTGVSLFEKIREIRKEVPVLICTGHSSLIDEEKARDLGVSAFVMKPIVMREIARIIRSVLDK